MGETTEIIRRRIHHWKTTCTGVALIVAPVAISIWPQHADVIRDAVTALAGAGFIAAADAQRRP